MSKPQLAFRPSAAHALGRLLLVIGLLGVALASVSPSLHAQTASAVFMGPQNMDPGLQNGLNNITGYVYSVLKFLSLIGLGVAYYFVTHHGVGKALLATVAAVLLWFAPVVSNIAENIGSSAAQQSTLSLPGH